MNILFLDFGLKPAVFGWYSMFQNCLDNFLFHETNLVDALRSGDVLPP